MVRGNRNARVASPDQPAALPGGVPGANPLLDLVITVSKNMKWNV